MARETRPAAENKYVDRPGLALAAQVTQQNQDGTAFVSYVEQGIADSLQAAGKATAPALGTAICTLAAPPAGVYRIEVDVNVSAATDVNNLKIQRGGVDLYNPVACLDKVLSEHEYRVTFSGAQNMTINAIAAGGAGVVYIAQIIATRIE